MCPEIGIEKINAAISELNGDRNGFDRQKTSAEGENSRIVAKGAAAAPDEKTTLAQNAVCIGTLEKIISGMDATVSKLDSLRKDPSLSKAMNLYYEKSHDNLDDWHEAIINDINGLYRKGCIGQQSILHIKEAKFAPSVVKKGQSFETVVTIERIGTQIYYGYVTCDMTRGSITETARLNSQCSIIGDEPMEFKIVRTAEASGNIAATCSVFGSFSEDCSKATEHDRTTLSNANAYSIDFSVASVAGLSGVCRSPEGLAAASTITCTVTLNGNEQSKTGFAAHPKYTESGFNCAACAVFNSTGKLADCSFISRNKLLSTFSCPVPKPGSYNMKGYVIDN